MQLICIHINDKIILELKFIYTLIYIFFRPKANK